MKSTKNIHYYVKENCFYIPESLYHSENKIFDSLQNKYINFKDFNISYFVEDKEYVPECKRNIINLPTLPKYKNSNCNEDNKSEINNIEANLDSQNNVNIESSDNESNTESSGESSENKDINYKPLENEKQSHNLSWAEMQDEEYEEEKRSNLSTPEMKTHKVANKFCNNFNSSVEVKKDIEVKKDVDKNINLITKTPKKNKKRRKNRKSKI